MPVVPVVAHGAHHGMFVVARGEPVARRLGLPGVRVKVFPVLFGPLGLTLAVPPALAAVTAAVRTDVPVLVEVVSPAAVLLTGTSISTLRPCVRPAPEPAPAAVAPRQDSVLGDLAGSRITGCPSSEKAGLKRLTIA